MAVKIRLKRTGRRNRPFYRVCVFDGRTRRDGQPVEELGSYDPRGSTNSEKYTLNRERAQYWLSVGAQPSETCASILRRLGVRKDGLVDVEDKAERPRKAPAPKAEPPKAEEAPAEEASAEAEATEGDGGDEAGS